MLLIQFWFPFDGGSYLLDHFHIRSFSLMLTLNRIINTSNSCYSTAKIQYLIRIRFFKIWTTLVRPVWSLRSKAHLVNPGARGAHLEFFCPLLPTFLRDIDKLPFHPFHNLRFSFTHFWTKPFLVLLCYCHCKNLLTFFVSLMIVLYTFFALE